MTVEQWLGKDNQLGIDIWHRKYQKHNETFDEWLDRVSLSDPLVKQLIIQKKFIPGGRILSNVGIEDEKSGMSNCYSRGFVEDDYNDIMQAAVDIGKTFKAQGGQGLSLSKLRPKGTPIGDNYLSDGIVPFMKIYNEVTQGTSQGGCIEENELVLTSEGYKPIKDIKVGDNVCTKAGYKPVLTVWDKGEQETYRVTTKKGYTISTTIDHKYCIDGFNVEPLSSLSIGDRVCLITSQPNNIKKELNEKAYFFAHFLANGYIRKDNTGNITMHKKYKEIGDRLISYLSSLGFNAYYNNREDENAIRIVLTVPVCKWIKQQVEKNTCSYIMVPDWVLTGDDDCVLSFIGGAIDSDGSVRKNSISCDTVCREYAEQISLLMKRVGFFPTISIGYRENESNKRPIYRVSDSIRDDILTYYSYKVAKNHISYAKNSKYVTPYTMKNTGLSKNDAKHLAKISKNTNIGLYTYLQVKDKPYAPMILDGISNIEYIGIRHVYDIEVADEHKFFCNGIYVSNSRKGALLMSLDAWHKEAMNFITIKSQDGLIEKANLSLEIDDEFMECVDKYYKTGEIITVTRHENYSGHEVEWEVTPIEVFKAFIHNNYDWGDPGCLFVNRFRNYNMMEYCDEYQVETCNPCGEQPLNKHGACNLASINLSEFVDSPYTDKASFDWSSFNQAVRQGIIYLDKIIDLNAPNHALPQQRENSLNFRNCGLGVFGYATMLMKMGMEYGSVEAIGFTDGLFHRMFHEAVWASNTLAKEIGAFPKYNPNLWESKIIVNHFTNFEIEEMKKYGLRNCSLLSIAPTGTIATMLNESGGCEPEFAISYTRRTVGLTDNQDHYYTVYCKAAREYKELYPDSELPDYFVSSSDIDPQSRVVTQAVMQDHVDTAISSTINLPESCTEEEMAQIYLQAWKNGLKGLTIFRSNCKRLAILTTDSHEDKTEAPQPQTETFIGLGRGDIVECSNDLIGKKRKLTTGCGSLHVLAFFDPVTGDMQEVYLNKGSTGGCANFMTGLSRTLSLLCRAGVDVRTIKDQLDSTGTCPSYATRAATKHDTSKGSCCPMGVGNALVEMWEEMQEEVRDNWEEEKNIETRDYVHKNKIPSKYSQIDTNSYAVCPECGEPLVFEGGCNSCKSCGYSKCN